MKYTEAQIDEIIDQLLRIKVDGEQVFIAIADESDGPYHKIYVDSGPTSARLEFEKAPEPVQSVKDREELIAHLGITEVAQMEE